MTAADKPELTKQLEGLRAEPGSTGDKSGGPSRWATEQSSEWIPLRLVAKVTFDHASGGRVRHGTSLLRFRPDKAPTQCRSEHIES